MLVLINFRGFHIEVEEELLKKFPEESGFFKYLQSTYGKTPEGLFDGSPPDNRVSRSMIYLNRNGFLFYSVLDYLETGQLHFDHNVCSGVILEELKFWGLDLMSLSLCCLDRVLKVEEEAKAMQRLEKKWTSVSDLNRVVHPGRAILGNRGKSMEQSRQDTGIQDLDNVTKLPVMRPKSKIHDIILHPTSSLLAKVYCTVVILTLILSVLILLLETLPSLRESLPTNNLTVTDTSIYSDDSKLLLETLPIKWLIVLDIATTAFLTLDFIARLALTRNRFKFLCKVITIIDIISIVPVWVSLVIGLYLRQTGNTNKIVHVFRYMALLRALRIFRFCHIALHNKQLRIIGLALHSSWKELLLLVSIIGMYACLFGISAFYIEHIFSGSYLASGFEGVYWAVITMTTVGYGDIYMATNVGRLLAVACCMVGIVVIAMTTTLLVNTFFTVYQTIEKIERLNKLKSEITSNRKMQG